MTIATKNIDGKLAELAKNSASLDAARMEAQRQADTYAEEVDRLARRMSQIQVARMQLAGLPSLEPEETWRNHLTTWRRTLADELLALPTRSDPHTFGTRRNLELSIQAIDSGLRISDTGYDLMTLRLGALMREAGYAPSGADPQRHYSGVMPWHGALPDVERRIANLQKERDAMQKQLDISLLDDAERTPPAS